jgi:hypothetical protein
MITQILFVTIYSRILHGTFLYIGPGVDGGSISLIIAFLVSFFTFLISIIWYPIKKTISFFKKITGLAEPEKPGDEATTDNNLPEEKV